MKIALSGLNNTDNPAPGIPVAKSLPNHELVGISFDPNEPGIYQNMFKNVYLMPFPSLGWEETKKRLIEIKNINKIEAIIPNLDAELPLYIKYQNELAELGIKTYLPSLENFEMREKRRLVKFSEKIGVKHPKTIEISSIDDLIKATKKIDFPMMIKGNYYKAYKANNLEEAIDCFYKISNEWGFPLLAQQIVNGIEINYIGLSDSNELKGGVGIKKLTTTEIGEIWSGVTIQNDTLINIAKKFVEVTNWRGAFEIEAISDGKDIYLIEINPRFPAWVYFATIVGVNLPEMMVQLMEGKEIKQNLEYPSNKMYVRYVDELVTDFNQFSKMIVQKNI